MSKVFKSVLLSAATPFIVDLRAIGDTTNQFNKVGWIKLRLRCFDTMGACFAAIKPIVVADGAAVPAAPAYPTLSANGDKADQIILNASGANLADGYLLEDSIELGQHFARGFNTEVYSGPLATHLAIAPQGTPQGILIIEAE